MPFEGFTTEDFDAYLPEKWSSNMFTLQRRKVKDKLDHLGRRLSTVFTAAGIELIPHLSDDHPSLWNRKKVDTQWLFFSRNEVAQKELSEIIDTERTLAANLADPTPLYRHIFIGVSLDQHRLEVGVRLHYDAWVDRRNFLALLANPDNRATFLGLCHRDLPGNPVIGISGGDMLPLAELNGDALTALAAAFEENHGWLFIGHRYDASSAADTGAAIADEISADVERLLAVYRHLAWAPGNDAISMDRIVAEKHELREAHLRELEQEQHQREARRAEDQSEKQRHREEIEQKVRDDEAWRERERAIRRAQAISRAEDEARAAMHRKSPASGTAGPAVSAGIAEPSSPATPDLEPDGNVLPPGLTLAPPIARETAPAPLLADRQPPRTPAPRTPDRAPAREARPAPGKPAPRPERPDNRGRTASPERGTHSERQRPTAPRPEPSRAKERSGSPVKTTTARPAAVSDKRREDIQIADQVEVQSGFLKGRIGIVQSIDEKGELKINFGALSSRVPRKDVKGLGPST